MPTELNQEQLFEAIIAQVQAARDRLERLRNALHEALATSQALAPLTHSIRSRVKDPDHLRHKLRRHWKEAQEGNRTFDVNPENILVRVNDLVGVRLVHLHTTQIVDIHAALLNLLEHDEYKVLEGPIAHVWDPDLKQYFEGIGFKTKENPRMYSSVHYVVEPFSRLKLTAEIQVRSIADELWGEVDHQLNYPDASEVDACRDQIKVLARLTSGCSRLVDSIFSVHASSNALGKSQSQGD